MPDTGGELAPNCDLAESPQSPTQCRPDRTCWLTRVVLVAYVVFLFSLALVTRRHEPIVQLENFLQPLDWAARILLAGVLAAARFLLLGFLIAVSAGRPTTSLRPAASLGRWLLALLLGIGLFALLSATESGRPPSLASSVVPLTGYLAGAWIGFTCLRGRRATLWLVPKLALLLLTLAAGAAGLVFLAVEDDSLSFHPPKVTSADKRRLAGVLNGSRPTGNGFQRLRLSEHDVNLLLAMAMAQTLPEGKARITLDRGTVTGEFSMQVDGSPTSPRYVNVHATCRAGVTAGRPEIRFEQCRVGRVAVPRLLLKAVSPLLTSAILDDPELEKTVATIDSVRVEPDGVETVFRSGELRAKLKEYLLARLGEKPDVVVRTQIYYRHLVRTAGELPADGRFAAFLQTAFRLAQRRSQGEDPVMENRAAILALAILLGHWRVESLVGPVTDEELRSEARRSIGKVALRDREDWRKHFLVSAALALLSNESLSDEVGLFKEELDAGEGGSGFSFSDLIADRAGTLFALAATRDEHSARRMQDRLAAGFEIEEIFPPAADLPEGIPDFELQAKYGGVGGERYNQVIREIDRRLAACAALR